MPNVFDIGPVRSSSGSVRPNRTSNSSQLFDRLDRTGESVRSVSETRTSTELDRCSEKIDRTPTEQSDSSNISEPIKRSPLTNIILLLSLSLSLLPSLSLSLSSANNLQWRREKISLPRLELPAKREGKVDLSLFRRELPADRDRERGSKSLSAGGNLPQGERERGESELLSLSLSFSFPV